MRPGKCTRYCSSVSHFSVFTPFLFVCLSHHVFPLFDDFKGRRCVPLLPHCLLVELQPVRADER